MENSRKFIKGKEYEFSTIERFIEANKTEESGEEIKLYELEELSKFNRVGEGFIILRHTEKDIIITFMLSGYTTQAIYECIYTDLY